MNQDDIVLAYGLLQAFNGISAIASLGNCIYLFTTRRKNLDTLAGRLIFYLCAADFLCELFYSLDVVNNAGYHKFSFNLCIFITYTSVAFSHCGSLWTLMMGVHLWRAVKGKREIEEWIYHAVCWGLPLLYLIIPIGLKQVGIGCYFNTFWVIITFTLAPRLVIFLCVFVTMGLVLMEMEKLRKAFAWSNNNSKKHTARRRLFLMQVWAIPNAVATIVLIIPQFWFTHWIFYIALWVNQLQGLANVLSTGEKKLILAIINLYRKIFRRKLDNQKATKLPHVDFEVSNNTSEAQIDGSLPIGIS